MGWDKIFNCERCGKKLWTSYRKLPDGKVVCNECYTFHLMQILDKINDNKAYDIVYNFVEKYEGNFPLDLLEELAHLLGIKYKITIDSVTLREVLQIIHKKIEKENNLKKLAKLERDLKRDMTQDFFCEVCNIKLPKPEYEYSMNNYGKPLCLHHQREKRASPHALKLYESLRRRGVFCELESSTSVKHVDIAVRDAKLYIGIDGEHHNFDPEQLYIDLVKDEESSKEGFATKRYSLKEIDESLEGIADTLAEVIKQRVKRIQQENFAPQQTVNKF
jgi:very-short-patch-repair endonuclease